MVGEDGIRMRVEHREAGVAVVTLAGEIDTWNLPTLRESLGLLPDDGVHHLVLDLSGVEFLESGGLSVMIELYRRLHRKGGSLRLAAVPEWLRQVLETTGLEQILPAHFDVPAALAAVPTNPSSA
ncbi:anti-sigma factor antagonist [Streptomyces alkaliphilus]|uniref:Anti-sigma factor antagonist n=1 Tax=Streptomyces alkaliphilus TaxID=1472722 RepID=A0A7W3Y2Z2_9ACTN|nr:STAS domain-containing protein [Streptomyces alkaliphilus]MBB0245921.1 anti-sigma factor antagonist [Streptomyces alkaliphilus]